MNVYLALFAYRDPGREKYVLIFRKRRFGYFFKGKAIGSRGQSLRGGGLDAFPGGGGSGSADALREFHEETGVDVSGEGTPILLSSDPGQYEGWGIEVSYSRLGALQHQIDGLLRNGDDIAQQISRGRIPSGDDISLYLPSPTPEDNEQLQAWTERVTSGLVNDLDRNRATDWFAAMVRGIPL